MYQHFKLMLQLDYLRYKIPFKYPFQTSHGLKTVQEGLLVSLGFGPYKGWGEMTSIPYYPYTDLEYIIRLLEEKRKVIESYAMTDPQRFWHFLHHLIPEHHFLISALDVAGWDLFGQMRRAPLHSLVGMKWQNIKPTCYTIASQNLDEIQHIINKERFPIYKMKLTHSDQLENVRLVRQQTNAKIWIDANEGWDAKSLLEILPELERLEVEMVEQPLPKDDWDGMMQVYEKKPASIAIIADESCQHLTDVDKVSQCFDGANIKLAKCGGITPALSMMQQLKKNHKKIMLGTMSESMPVAAATALLAPVVDFVDVDAPLLLEEKLGRGLLINQDGIYKFSHPIGIGYQFI